jgi:hypothetical protein
MTQQRGTLISFVMLTWVVAVFGACSHDETDTHDCYSPTQNLNHAYDDGTVGCACGAEDRDQCITGVALVCENARWQAVIDGPCAPGPGEACGKGFCSQSAHCVVLADDGGVCESNTD